MKAKKEYITLRFIGGIKNVPILAKTPLCGVDGFAVHRLYYSHSQQSPQKGLYRVSHIETGAAIANGPSIPEAIAAAEAKCTEKGGPKAIAKAVRKLKKGLANA